MGMKYDRNYQCHNSIAKEKENEIVYVERISFLSAISNERKECGKVGWNIVESLGNA